MLIISCLLFDFLLITIILMKVYQNDIIGYIGERHTAKLIKRASQSRVYRDVYVAGSHGVQQIDLIAVTPKGILVVEKKTYIGLIVGRAYDKQWKVFVNRGRQKFSMKNPHHQNFGHIQALYENFPSMKDKCIDLVIFGNNAKLGDGIPAGTIRDADIGRFYEELPNALSSRQIADYSGLIEKLLQNKSENKKMHKKKIVELKRNPPKEAEVVEPIVLNNGASRGKKIAAVILAIATFIYDVLPVDLMPLLPFENLGLSGAAILNLVQQFTADQESKLVQILKYAKWTFIAFVVIAVLLFGGVVALLMNLMLK